MGRGQTLADESPGAKSKTEIDLYALPKQLTPQEAPHSDLVQKVTEYIWKELLHIWPLIEVNTIDEVSTKAKTKFIYARIKAMNTIPTNSSPNNSQGT